MHLTFHSRDVPWCVPRSALLLQPFPALHALPTLQEDEDEDEFGLGSFEEGETEAEAKRLWLERRQAREEDAKFPDEVDTPLDQPARTRFARYRGLKSWRTSTWHPKENLPAEYGKVYQFEQYPALQRHALRNQAAAAEDHPDSVAPVGAYVAIRLRVPATFAARYGVDASLSPDGPAAFPTLVVCGVNTYEDHMSVLHFSMTLSGPAEAADVTLKGKQRFLFRCGFRTFSASPIFSEDARLADKFKLERYVQPRQQLVASIYAPALYAPAPMLAFLEPTDPMAPLLAVAAAATAEDGSAAAAAAAAALSSGAGGAGNAVGVGGPLGVPVGYGSLLSVNADRIIVKKIMLTGLPFKCMKKKAVVRFMFFSPEDVRWFKPVELHTKLGRKGSIRESLGTHGYMKCIFDGIVHQHDTVCMNLYKRAFPKFGAFTYRA